MSEYQSSAGGTGQQARGEAGGTAERTREAASQVAGTVGEQGRAVAGEAAAQARSVAVGLRDRAGLEVRSQTHRLAETLRQWSDDLSSMADSGKPDSPARGLVGQVAERGRRMADYLDERGLGGAVDEVQRFARRRPGAFLAGAAVAGFLVGRMGKAAMRAQSANDGRPAGNGRQTMGTTGGMGSTGGTVTQQRGYDGGPSL